MRPTLQDLVKTLESLSPDDRQTYIEDFLAQIECGETSSPPQPASLREVHEGALQQIAAGKTMTMDEFCARAQALDVGSDAIGTD